MINAKKSKTRFNTQNISIAICKTLPSHGFEPLWRSALSLSKRMIIYTNC